MTRLLLRCLALLLALPLAGFSQAKLVPRMQAIPLPDQQVSFQRDGQELARYHYAKDQRRPFVYPVNGPSGRSLTRMGHPRDPESHSHHNSVWFSHQFVGGVNFWEDRGGKVEHVRLLKFEDGDEFAYIEVENVWLSPANEPVARERRRIGARAEGNREWVLVLDMEMLPAAETLTLAPTAFGMIGVRMAKTIGVNDGGGQIRNSEGGVNEEGCFRKPGRWIDYSGPITANATEGIALLDHPSNPHHPAAFHCRNDGWMGASLTLPGELTIAADKPLRLRYALFVHAGQPEPAAIEEQWKHFAELPWLPFPEKKDAKK